ncbi:TonB-dependent receptor [Aquincola tertiaricarbonis]|uniref:TonB-dependent receptor n=1 Tax=Aquincola tertiaricarbonis TaxID=391953 RepID=A0ABY4S9L2_AQUTE|nr:TonB-dependent receptor [Aquincola tertiaricarbonis]URI10036.1 TonB-dependent receptor [Aquincola tertiaricarbonis]
MQSVPPALSALARAALLALGAAAAVPAARAQATTDTAPVQQVLINASADASAEGLKAPYAGRQVARGGRVGLLGNQDVMDTPFSQTSYTQDLIQNQQAASIGDVLRNDPTVRVARGFGNYQQLYLIRGFPVYSDDMAYNGLYGLLPRQYLAAELIERVEVLRGANSFVNGVAPTGNGGGLGGAINVMPKRAPNQPVNQVTVGVESGGQGYLAADVARRFGPDQNTGLRLTAVRRDGDTAIDSEQRELGLLGVGLDWRSRHVRVSADIGYQDQQLRGTRPSVTPGSYVPSAPDADSNPGQPWTVSNERDTFGTLRAEFDLAPQTTAWLAAGARRGKEFNDLAGVTVTGADGATSLSRFANVRRDDIATGELGLRHTLTTGSVKHQLVAAAALYTSKERNAYFFYGPNAASNLYDPPTVTPPATPSFTGGTLDDPLVVSRIRTRSLALADTLSFADDSIKLTLGVRHQSIETTGYDYNTGVQNAHYDESKVTPMAGLLVKLSKQVSVYGTYAEGLVKGDEASGSYLDGNGNSKPISNQGEVFAPYVTKQMELGAKLDTGRFGGTLALFQARKPIAGVEGTRFVDSAYKQTNRGLEATLFGEATRGLRLLGGATYLHTDVQGDDAVGAPKWQLNANADWDVPGVPGLALTGRVTYTGKQYADAANTLTVKAWTRLDVGARYGLTLAGRDVTLRANINNLTNRDYWASVGGFPGANYLVLGDPRTVVLSATVDF